MVEEPPERYCGRILGGTYEVQRLLGAGGMGVVFEAIHLRLGKRVAVKVLSSLDPKDPMVAHRFRREAKIATDLGHPHIIDVIDYNETDDGLPYMVMELLEGEDLDSHLQRTGSVSPVRMAFLVRQVCSALHTAHERGVVHRDLKPANIFLCRNKAFEDFVVVLDFGISKVLGASSLRTREDLLIGTPHYMAPEQVENTIGPVGPATDIFALGAIIYHMLTGALPFDAESVPALLYQLVHVGPPPVRSRRPGLPEAVAAIVQRAMAKAPGERFRSVRDLSLALLDALPEVAELATGRSWEETVRNSGRAVALDENAERDAALAETVISGATSRKAAPASTLSSVASELVEGRSRRSWIPLGVLIAVVVVVFGTVALLLASGVGQPQPRTERRAATTWSSNASVDGGARSSVLRSTEDHADARGVRQASGKGEAPGRGRATQRPWTVVISIVGEPRGALVQEPSTGKVLTRVPGAVRLPRSLGGVELRVSHDGYTFETVRVRPDRSRRVEVHLKRLSLPESDLPPNPWAR